MLTIVTLVFTIAVGFFTRQRWTAAAAGAALQFVLATGHQQDWTNLWKLSGILGLALVQAVLVGAVGYVVAQWAAKRRERLAGRRRS